MALPVAIGSASNDLGLRNSYHGPFKSSGGAFYVITVDDGGNGRIHAFKATDPTVSFTEQDSSNRPAPQVQITHSLNVFQDSDNLYVCWQDGANDVWFALFDMSSDAWQDVDATAGTQTFIAIDGAPNGTAFATDLAVLSAAYGVGSAFVKIRTVYQGQTDMDMGGDFERIDESNSVDDGVTWSGPNQIDDGASVPGVHYTGPRIVLPPNNSDQCHVFYRNNDTDAIRQRAIAGDDTLRTDRNTNVDNDTDLYPITHGIGFMRSSVSKVRIGFRGRTTSDLEVLEFDAFSDDTNPSFSDSPVSTDDVQVDNGSITACLAADGSVVRGLMVKASDDDLYEFFDDDADSYTLEGTAHLAGTVNHISCNRYGTKLAMVYDDAGTVKYDEISLAAPPAGPPIGTLALLGVGI